MGSIGSHGFSHERELARRLWRLGYAVMRSPASGRRTKFLKYPDLIAIKNRRILVFEVKTTRSLSDIYIPSRQVEKLLEFAKRAGGEAYIAVKIIGSGKWVLVKISDLVKVSESRFKVSAKIISNSSLLEDII